MNSHVRKPGVHFVSCGLASLTWSSLVWLLLKTLHNRVEYFLVGPAQVLILGAAFTPLLIAAFCAFLPQPKTVKAAAALGLALPALFTLALVCARLFA